MAQASRQDNSFQTLIANFAVNADPPTKQMKEATEGSIIVRNARVNNLKGVDVTIPRERLTVITGVSGSGKSSLARDTLYAEGQRRYVESLSAYARQFMGKMAKPEADLIDGLPPAIAIEQKVTTRNPRSTVGTQTEIYDYLRLLYGRAGKTYSPISGREVTRHTVEDVLKAFKDLPIGTRVAITVPVIIPEGRKEASQLDVYLKAGYTRLFNTETKGFEDINLGLKLTASHRLLIDRMAVSANEDEISRLAESAEAAFFEGHGRLTMHWWDEKGEENHRDFSTLFEEDGILFDEPTDMMFNFNNPVGACDVCGGFGSILGISPDLVIPNPRLSIYEEAVAPWRGQKMSDWRRRFCAWAAANDFDVHKPVLDLTEQEKDILWHGVKGRIGFPCIDEFFDMVRSQQQKIQYRVMLARYRGKTVCPACHGTRLKSSAVNVKVGGKTITELVKLPIKDLREFFSTVKLDKEQQLIAKRVLQEIRSRIDFLCKVGLDYLTLDRLSSTLSGGESQRVNLSTALGSSLTGSLYLLDEPSIGLHPRDTDRLISVLQSLKSLGNTVVVVEHDEEIMRNADYLIDVGPDAGRLGGEIVYQGPAKEIFKSQGYTAQYLRGELSIPVPKERRKHRDYIEVVGALEHNLKDVTVKFPLGVFTVVTGVSGSGKSTLVRDILYRAMMRHLGEGGEAPGKFRELRGDMGRIKAVEFVDQNPIGKSSRSNPATYLKAYDEIRSLFANQQVSKQMGFTPSTFSFNSPASGRCEACNGEGVRTIEMQFMADISITCEECHGKRFKRDVLEAKYRDKSIYDILEMTIDQAIEFFSQEKGTDEKRIIKRLKPLSDVGLGYVKVGQSSSTLSGGENQRVKLASFIAMESQQPTLFIFDEPTTGLHFNDIATLMKSFDRLIEAGHTIVVIEHNLDMIKCADHIIDVGPEGGDLGGYIVATGTPEEIAANPESITGRYLCEKLNNISNDAKR